MSLKLQKDIEYATAILNGECSDIFRKIFANTNENLLQLFNKIDLTGKNVFTVLSSSDYLYMSYLFGARNVDCFDINPLTYRFFYLRKWLISNDIIDLGTIRYNDVLRILECIKIDKSNDEKESLFFWRDILPKIDEMTFYDIFDNPLFIIRFNPFNYFYDDKKNSLSNILSSISPKFCQINICRDSILNECKQYDYIFLSNIIDYNRNKESLEVLVNNLIRLTNEHGKVICAHMSRIANEDFSQEFDFEKGIFKRAFEYSRISSENERVKYYQYIKK